MLAPVGSNIKGQQAWFQLPGGFKLQPSEFAKFGIIIALAGYLNQYRGELDAWRLTVTLGLAAVPIGLVLLQPDLGTALVLGVIIVGLLAIAGVSGKQLAVIGAAHRHRDLRGGEPRGAEAVPDRPAHVFAGDRPPQESAYNQNQSTQAIANGRFGGEGFGEGSQTQGSFVPEQHTDFIFTAVGEELGFVGARRLLGLLARRDVADLANGAARVATSSARSSAPACSRCSRSRSSRTSG